MYVDFQTPEALMAHYAAVRARINKPAPAVKAVPAPPIPVFEAPPVEEVEKKAPTRLFFPHIRAREIVAECADEYGVSEAELLGDRRGTCFVHARRKACFLISKELGWSLPRIGRFIRKDHTTVLHAIRRYEGELVRVAMEARK